MVEERVRGRETERGKGRVKGRKGKVEDKESR